MSIDGEDPRVVIRVALSEPVLTFSRLLTLGSRIARKASETRR